VDDASAEQQSRLEAVVAAYAGAAGFPALAELYRRSDRLADAEAVARAGLAVAPDSLEGRAVLALVLMDRGRQQDARQELEQLAVSCVAAHALPAAPDAASGLSQAELDAAFDDAETDAEALIDPNRVAEEAIDHADAGAEGLVEESPLAEAGPFATRTMAELLERQGDVDGAARIRAALGGADGAMRTGGERVDADGAMRTQEPRDDAAAETGADAERAAPPARSSDAASRRGSGHARPPGDTSRGVIIAVLERWLDNARRART
jgi:hypothetical protein